jgi:hypothetical protein
MVNLVETLFGITIGAMLIAGLAYVQSRSGPERAPRYQTRMRRALAVAAISGALAVAGEIVLQLRT